jgi:DNA-binding CsgD family transcriptional regulator
MNRLPRDLESRELPDHLYSLLRELTPPLREFLRSDSAKTTFIEVTVDGIRCSFEDLRSEIPSPSLSPREGEIAGRIARGQTNRAIAHALGISEWTVSTYIRRAFTKFGVRSRAELIAVLSRQRRPIA